MGGANARWEGGQSEAGGGARAVLRRTLVSKMQSVTRKWPIVSKKRAGIRRLSTAEPIFHASAVYFGAGAATLLLGTTLRRATLKRF